MRTSLIEIQQIETFLQGQASPEESQRMQARLREDSDFAERVADQQRALLLIREHGRQLVREEIARVDHAMFHSPRHHRFRQRIRSLFKSR